MYQQALSLLTTNMLASVLSDSTQDAFSFATGYFTSLTCATHNAPCDDAEAVCVCGAHCAAGRVAESWSELSWEGALDPGQFGP